MKTQRTNVIVYIILILILLGVGFWIYRISSKKSKPVTVQPSVETWEKSVEEFYNSAKQVEPTKNTKALADELTPIIKDTVKNDIKLTESTDNKLVFVLKTIVVEGDVDNIKKALEAKNYKNVTISDKFKKLTAEKNGKTITMTFSVDTTNQGKIEISL